MRASLQKPAAGTTATPAGPAAGQKGATQNPTRAHLYPPIQETGRALPTAGDGTRGTSRFDFSRVPARAPVQRLARSGSNGSFPSISPAQICSAAALGTSGVSQALPHQATIQQSFGRHDLSGVRAHTDSAARAGARGMQAEAFTQGSHVAFARSPSLHLAAHEAAHVLQQRAGVQLGNGIGQRNDRHEQHAEAVAQRVTSGQSSEKLLDAYAVSDGTATEGVQRFESEEHQHLGDVATGSKKYDLADKAKNPSDTFELTHGDIVALSGDVFEPDDLFRLAAIPGDHGKKKGTRDEVIYGLLDSSIWEMRAGKPEPGPYTGKEDPRMGPGGIWAGWVFDPAVIDSVTERYKKLAAKNAGHFAAPLGRDQAGDPVPAANSAGGNYRTLHEAAVRLAYRTGVLNGGYDMPLAHEAAAQHFLTDAFSAGHLRTPIGLIREYWGKKYPLFFFNLLHKIALDTAIELASGTPVPNHTAYASIWEEVAKIAPSLPSISLGDLLGSVFHDVDNASGVKIEGGGQVFGDAHLDAGTEKLAVAAIQAGNRDVYVAYALGKGMTQPIADADLFSQVISRNGGANSKFAAENMMPKPDAGEPPQTWKAADINALWDQTMLGTTGDTVGQAIIKTVQGGSIAAQLMDIAEKFPPTKLVFHPRKDYIEGFVRKIQRDPKAGVLDIINWAPHDMWTGNAPREMMADLAKSGAANPQETVANMTPEQRLKVTRGLISDGESEDQDMILRMFRGIGHAQRLDLYQQIEGHPWTGDFQRHLGSRDDLYKVMDKKTGEWLKISLNAP